MDKTIPLNAVHIGMEVDHYNMVEDDPHHSLMWEHLPGGRFRLVQMRTKPEHIVNFKPTKDPKGLTREKDEWKLDPKTLLYVKKEEKKENKSAMSMVLIVVGCILVLWYLLLGNIRRG